MVNASTFIIGGRHGKASNDEEGNAVGNSRGETEFSPLKNINYLQLAVSLQSESSSLSQ